MNILHNARWGYTGDGMACGPVGGCDAVELVIEREKGKLTFFRFDCMDQFGAVTIQNHSTFDSFVFINDMGEQDDPDYDFDMYEFEDEIDRDDPNFSVINLGLTVLKQVREIDEYDEDGSAGEYDGARAFVKNWFGRDLDKCEIPLFKLGDEDEEDEEEEEE